MHTRAVFGHQHKRYVTGLPFYYEANKYTSRTFVLSEHKNSSRTIVVDLRHRF